MRNGLGRAAPENAELAFSGGFAATDETDFELIRYSKGCNIIYHASSGGVKQ